MRQVEVIAEGGLALRGPARVKLTPAQLARRPVLAGRASAAGVVELDGGDVLRLKRGERFGVAAIDKVAGAAVRKAGGATAGDD